MARIASVRAPAKPLAMRRKRNLYATLTGVGHPVRRGKFEHFKRQEVFPENRAFYPWRHPSPA